MEGFGGVVDCVVYDVLAGITLENSFFLRSEKMSPLFLLLYSRTQVKKFCRNVTSRNGIYTAPPEVMLCYSVFGFCAINSGWIAVCNIYSGFCANNDNVHYHLWTFG